jgi:hypothetical protein
MDAIHYEKIADKLMQFRGKLPKDAHLSTEFGEQTTARIQQKIQELLECIDWYADFDNLGLIR